MLQLSIYQLCINLYITTTSCAIVSFIQHYRTIDKIKILFVGYQMKLFCIQRLGNVIMEVYCNLEQFVPQPSVTKGIVLYICTCDMFAKNYANRMGSKTEFIQKLKLAMLYLLFYGSMLKWMLFVNGLLNKLLCGCQIIWIILFKLVCHVPYIIIYIICWLKLLYTLHLTRMSKI